MEIDEEPAVLGAGCMPLPMPSPQEEWMAKYVGRMVEHGVIAEDAWALCRAGSDDHDYAGDPRDTADEEMTYWDDDGDG